MLVDLISGLVEGGILGGGRRRRSYKRGTTVFVGGSDIWPGRGSDPWWWVEDYCILISMRIMLFSEYLLLNLLCRAFKF